MSLTCRDCGKESEQPLCNRCALQHSHDFNDAKPVYRTPDEAYADSLEKKIEKLEEQRAQLVAVARAAKEARWILDYLSRSKCACDRDVNVVCEGCALHSALLKIIKAVDALPPQRVCDAIPPGFPGSFENPIGDDDAAISALDPDVLK